MGYYFIVTLREKLRGKDNDYSFKVKGSGNKPKPQKEKDVRAWFKRWKKYNPDAEKRRTKLIKIKKVTTKRKK